MMCNFCDALNYLALAERILNSALNKAYMVDGVPDPDLKRLWSRVYETENDLSEYIVKKNEEGKESKTTTEL